jgi:diguanylate cyclase (GGDEF)-like protein
MAGRGTAQAPSVASMADRQHGSRAPLDPRAILTSIGEVIYDWDIATDAISWGLNAADVLGCRDASLLSSGKAFALAIEPGCNQTRHEAIASSASPDHGTGVPYRTRYGLRLSNGQTPRIEDTGRWYADASGEPAFAHGVVRLDRSAQDCDIGLRTGSRDRLNFLDQIRGDVADAARSKRAVTLLVVAVHELGHGNEEIGYEYADAVLREVTRRLQTVLRRRDRLVHYASNRFVVALSSCASHQAELAAARVAEIVEAAPVGTRQGDVLVRVRIGAATAPDHAVEAPELLRRAEDALGAAKHGYGRPFVLYDPHLAREATRRSRGTPPLDVLDALNGRRVAFARQPVVEAHSRALAFSEALVRIRRHDGCLIQASDILPTAERAGLVHLIDTRMLELTTDYLADHPEERMAINVSPLTIENIDWLGVLAAHLGARPGIASRLIVEITETAAVRDPAATRSRLDAMKALGVAIAIDDFGAGHTSFKHLRSFPIDILKIDGAFVQNLSRSQDDRFFVRTLVDLAQHLDIATVAEWVEDEETARMLAEWGIDYLQGDHCGKPVVVGEPASAECSDARVA